eukprot:1847007-Pleurochrysis_carterae.AAC.3
MARSNRDACAAPPSTAASSSRILHASVCSGVPMRQLVSAARLLRKRPASSPSSRCALASVTLAACSHVCASS